MAADALDPKVNNSLVNSGSNDDAPSQAKSDMTLPEPLARAKDRFDELPQRNKMFAVGGIVLLIATLLVSIMWGTASEYKPLFNGVTAEDGGAIIEALDQMKVPYQFGKDETTIMVPTDRVHDVRLALANRGLPKGSVIGYEAMDNQEMGVTQFQEQVNFQRALEGELVRSIMSIDGIDSARVHLAIPKPSIFIRDEQEPSASVVLNVRSGSSVSKAQVRGIVHLVSSSLPNLVPDRVQVVDQRGRLLTEAGSDETGINASQLAYVDKIERGYTARIVDILAPIFGQDNVKATVTADIDFSKQRSTQEIYTPNSAGSPAAIRSRQLMKKNDEVGENPGGIPGALSNEAPGQTIAPIGTNPQENLILPVKPTELPGQKSTTNSEESITNYEVDKNVIYTENQIGQIQKVSAAVVVNFKTIADNKGELRQVPLTPEEITQINSLVREAIGFQEVRGDSISVANQQFTNPDWLNPNKEAEPTIMSMAEKFAFPLAIALIAALLVFGVIRPMMSKRRMDEGPELIPDGENALLTAIAQQEAKALENMSLSMAQDDGVDHVRRLVEVAKDKPEMFASIIRGMCMGDKEMLGLENAEQSAAA